MRFPRAAAWLAEPVQRRLRARQVLTAVVGLAVLGLAVVDLTHGQVGPLTALAGLVGGAVVGLVALRINRVGWHAGTGRIVSRMDRVGLVILFVLLVARLSRTWLLEHWVTGALLTALGLWITVGTLAVRVLGTRRAVVTALRDTGTRPPRSTD